MSDEILAENSVTRKETTGPAPSQKLTQESKKKVENKSTHVKVSTVKNGGGRVKKHTDVGAMMTQNLELFKRALEQRQNNQFELLNENVHGLAERMQLTADKAEKNSNHMLKLIEKVDNFMWENSY